MKNNIIEMMLHARKESMEECRHGSPLIECRHCQMLAFLCINRHYECLPWIPPEVCKMIYNALIVIYDREMAKLIETYQQKLFEESMARLNTRGAVMEMTGNNELWTRKLAQPFYSRLRPFLGVAKKRYVTANHNTTIDGPSDIAAVDYVKKRELNALEKLKREESRQKALKKQQQRAQRRQNRR